MPEPTPEQVDVLARLVADALYGPGAGEFNAATGATVRMEAAKVAGRVLAAGYQPPARSGSDVGPAEPFGLPGSREQLARAQAAATVKAAGVAGRPAPVRPDRPTPARPGWWLPDRTVAWWVADDLAEADQSPLTDEGVCLARMVGAYRDALAASLEDGWDQGDLSDGARWALHVLTARGGGDSGGWCEQCWDDAPHTRCYCAPAPEDEPVAGCPHCGGTGACPTAGGGRP